ncbi:5'-3' exoribonuclease 2 [Kalmusia sp. IMI 367209]|nr:5'-3' exoribonuclease 2 [Kalmusia sp. IMI 367209]
MGVPAMFRWLSQKYPKIISSVIEDLPKKVGDETIPVDRTQPNPNGEEFDNLYLDMNGIVHPCSHPEDKPAPKTEADMMLAIFEYTDRVVGMVRPRKLLYLAVDGVAPRAKMNQQRSRRFRSAKEAKEKDEEKAEFLKMLNSQKASRGEDITSLDQVVEKTWDSNAITPGTPFMFLLAESLQYWCAYKFTTDPSWQNMKVIISDASVPGEGEHKIMNFIRSQRSMPTHNPNTRHVIYGLDADLIMLGLATHEPHFRVLREDVFFDSGKDKSCTKCGRKGHIRPNCPHPDDGTKLTEDEARDEWAAAEHPLKPFIWLHINILREYLAVEMDSPLRKFPHDVERALDDWVFMCFFVGNDFLPHLPSLEIRDQGIDLLTRIWRELLPQMDDYVTKNGFPNMKMVQQILQALAGQEAEIFRKRKEISDRQAAKRAQREAGNQRGGRNSYNGAPPPKRRKEDTSTYLDAGVMFFSPQQAQSNEVRAVTKEMLANKNQTNKSAAAQLKALMKAKGDGTAPTDNASQGSEAALASASASGQDTPVHLGKRTHDAVEDSENGTPGRSTPIVPESPSEKKEGEPPEDTVKLWEAGYEERYYAQKFQVEPDDMEFRHEVARSYAEGLCWVLSYYFQGCQSWTWYFPYHYAPFAADFVGIADLDPHKMFTKGKPFHPYEQLMGVLPAASNHAIPEPFRILMSDPNSNIVDFYPEDFPIDLNGKKFAWQGVAILPFIDEKRLLAAMATKYGELTDDEKRRNEFGKETLMFSQTGRLFGSMNKALYQKGVEKLQIDHEHSDALHGEIERHDLFVLDSQLVPPFDADSEEFDIVTDGSIRVYYEMPKVDSKTAHKSILLKGIRMPERALNESDEAQVRRQQNGRGGYRGGRGGGRGDYNNRRSFDNNGGGYNNDRGGYGNRGRGGFDNNRGGSNNGRGGYNSFPPGPPPPFPGTNSWPHLRTANSSLPTGIEWHTPPPRLGSSRASWYGVMGRQWQGSSSATCLDARSAAWYSTATTV